HKTPKLGDSYSQHVRGSLGTSAKSHLAERADQRPGKLNSSGLRVAERLWRSGVEQRVRRQCRLPRVGELLADFGRSDLRRLAASAVAVLALFAAALLAPVCVLGEGLRSVQDLGDLAEGHGANPGRFAGRAERDRGRQLSFYQLQLVPLDHPPSRRPRPPV